MSPIYESLPTQLHVLFNRSPPPPLCPSKTFDAALTPVISSLGVGPSVISGLHLLNDDIDNAHSIAQGHEGDKSCDTWHAFLHRREGDYWNSGWWIARLNHPLLLQFANTTSIQQARSNAKAFVSSCEKVGTGRSPNDELEKRQYDELKALAEWCIENDK